MDRKLVAGVGLAVVLLLLALAWFLRPVPGAEPPGTGVRSQLPQPDESPALVPVAPREAPREQAPVVAPAGEPEPGPDPALAIVRGRCVRAEDGLPLAGCSVRFTGSPRNSQEMALHGPVDWTQPEPVLTGPDGRFEIAFVPPPPYQHSLDVSCEGRVPRTARWGPFEPGQVEDLGDVALAGGHVVEGLVVDTDGAWVAGASVQVRGLPLPLRDDMAANDTRSDVSDEVGRFRLDVPIPAGTWSLDVGGRGLKLVEPDRVSVSEGLGAAPVTVVVRRMPSISGVVVDETGAGVPRVWLNAELRKSRGRMASGRTREDGSFTIFAVDEELYPVRLRVDDPGPCEPLDEPTGEIAWGAADVRIELVRALSFELEVVERDSGAPVEEFAVVCHAERARSSRQRDARLGGHHPGGRVRVDAVWRGTNRLEVRPNDPALAPSEPLLFEAAGPPLAPMRVELVRMQPRAVRVLTGAGDPVEGSRVELVRLGDVPLDAGSLVLDRARGMVGFSPHRMHELLSTRTTDARGEVELFVPPDEELGLRVLGAAHLPLVVPRARFPADGPLELVVEAGGFLAGRIRLAGWSPADLGLQIDPADAPSTFAGLEPGARLDADGRFRSAALAPGAWTLALRLSTRFEHEGGSSGQVVRLGDPLATAVVEAGRTTEVDLDASHLGPGRVRGRALLDGAPAGAARCFLRLERARDGAGQAGFAFGQYVPDPAGRFEATALPPGTYRAGLVTGDFKSSGGVSLLADDLFELGPGETLERTFAFVHRRVVLRLLEPDGVTPVPDAAVELTTSTYERSRLRTDGDGRLVLDPAPGGALQLVLPDRALWIDALTPPAGDPEVALDVVLAPRG